MTIDLHDEVFAVCAKLDLDPSRVAELVLRPSTVTATVYTLNDAGARYIDPDTNEPATLQHEYDVTT